MGIVEDGEWYPWVLNLKANIEVRKIFENSVQKAGFVALITMFIFSLVGALGVYAYMKISERRK